MVTYLHHEPSWRPRDDASRAVAPQPPRQEGWPEPPARVSRTSTDPADQQPPMGLATLFSVAFGILRRRYRSLMAVALVVAALPMLLALVANVNYQSAFQDVYGDGGSQLAAMIATDQEIEKVDAASVPSVLASLLQTVFILIAGLGFAAIVASDFYARPVRASVGLRVCRGRWLSAIAAALMLGLAVIGLVIAATVIAVAGVLIGAVMGDSVIAWVPMLLGGLVAIVVFVYPLLRLSATFSAMAVEDLGWRDSLGRSWGLTRDRVLRVFVVTALTAVLVGLAGVLLALLASELIMGTIGTTSGWDRLIVDGVTTLVVTLLLLPVYSVVAAVLYFDLRARRRVHRPEGDLTSRR